jgi:hypothetical protein
MKRCGFLIPLAFGIGLGLGIPLGAAALFLWMLGAQG